MSPPFSYRSDPTKLYHTWNHPTIYYPSYSEGCDDVGSCSDSGVCSYSGGGSNSGGCSFGFDTSGWVGSWVSSYSGGDRSYHSGSYFSVGSVTVIYGQIVIFGIPVAGY